MRIGISPFAASRQGMVRVADAAAQGGIGAFWLGDGLLVVDRFPRWSGGLEPFTELGWLAGRHPGVDVGLGAAVLPLRDVLWVAKQANTLDQLTEGRFTLVVTPGIWEREFAFRGLSFRDRGRRFDDFVAALQAALAGRAYEGHDVRLPVEGQLSPAPHTPGGPPLWLAGGRATFERALKGGLPFQARRPAPAALAPLAREWFDRGGTTLGARVAFDVADRPGDDDPETLVGPPGYLVDQLAAYTELGVTDVSLMPGQDDDRSLRNVEALVTEVLPAFRA